MIYLIINKLAPTDGSKTNLSIYFKQTSIISYFVSGAVFPAGSPVETRHIGKLQSCLLDGLVQTVMSYWALSMARQKEI